MTPEIALQKYFDISSFRQSQKAIIDSVLSGKDTLVVMPTGGGKSLCFQLPALLLPGVTVVISPLIALMKDQVDALRLLGLSAGLLNSLQSYEEQQSTLHLLRTGKLKLVYVAPERFRSRSFLNALPADAIGLLAVDEAHCLSQWGHDFRPDYMRLGEVRKSLGSPPCIALTATATPDVRTDIKSILNLDNPAEFVAGFARENLSFRVRKTSSDEGKKKALFQLIEQHRIGIVYCSTRKSVDKVAEMVQPLSGSAIRYHAGLSDKERMEVQNIFMRRESELLIATNAFGMGIDRPDIRFVCHYEMPGSVEAYYQEGGRAGRDGVPATCEMLFSYADKRVQDFFIEGANPEKAVIAQVFDHLCSESDENHEVRLSIEALSKRIQPKVHPMAVSTSISILSRHRWIERFDISGDRVRGTRILERGKSGLELPLDSRALEIKAERDKTRLNRVIDFAYASGCRQQWILRYFGEQNSQPCGRCDHCEQANQSDQRELGPEEWQLIRMVLSGIARMSQKYGRDEWIPRFGKRKIIQCLMGSQAAPIMDANLNLLSTYGILKKESIAYLNALFEHLEQAGLVETNTQGKYPLLGLTQLGSKVMRSEAKPPLHLPKRETTSADTIQTTGNTRKSIPSNEIQDTTLYRKLVAKRSELAAASGKPPYMVFTNIVLVELTNQKPQKKAEAIKIKGIGPAKLHTVLPHFLDVIAEHTAQSTEN